MEGGVGYYSLGLHGAIHDTTAKEQWVLTYVKVELTRNQLLLNRLQEKYDEDCKCFSAQNTVPPDIPRLKPPITIK